MSERASRRTKRRSIGMDQPFITAGFLTAAFVGCLVSVSVAAVWPLVPAAVCALIGSLLLGYAGVAKPMLLDQLWADVALQPVAVDAEVRWSAGRILLVAVPNGADAPQRVIADAGSVPLRPGCGQAVVEVGALRDGDPSAQADLIALLAPTATLRAVESKAAAARLAGALEAAGFGVDERRTWLTWPPSQVVRASRQAATPPTTAVRQ